jgi:hypothetical protein
MTNENLGNSWTVFGNDNCLPLKKSFLNKSNNFDYEF